MGTWGICQQNTLQKFTIKHQPTKQGMTHFWQKSPICTKMWHNDPYPYNFHLLKSWVYSINRTGVINTQRCWFTLELASYQLPCVHHTCVLDCPGSLSWKIARLAPTCVYLHQNLTHWSWIPQLTFDQVWGLYHEQGRPVEQFVNFGYWHR